MPWITVSVVLGTVLMLVIGIMIMYETKAFWGLENNTNAATLNSTMNFATSYNIMPVIIVVVALCLVALFSTTYRGFG